MKIKHALRAAALACLLAAAACEIPENELPELADSDRELAFPLFSTTLTAADLAPRLLSDSLPGDTLLIAPDGSMTLFYSGQVAEKDVKALFKLQDTTFITPLFDTLTVYNNTNLPGGFFVRLGIIESGRTKLTILKSVAEPVTGRLRIPELVKNGQIFIHEFSVPANGQYFGPEIDLAGWELRSTQNQVSYIYEAYTPDGTRIRFPDLVPGLPSVGVHSIQVHNSYLEGFWGKQEFTLENGRIELDLNRTAHADQIRLSDPRITFTVENSFGFPMQGRVKFLRFVSKTGEKTLLQSSYIAPDKGIDFNYPRLDAGQVGQSAPTVFYFDKTNSNIVDIFSLQPVAVEYEVAGVTNPTNDPNIVGFLTDTSRVRFLVKAELPLEGSTKTFTGEQDLDINFSSFQINDDADFEEVELKLVTENGMPFSAVSQIQFLDDQGIAFDSLFAEGERTVMAAPATDAQGLVVAPVRAEHFLKMENARFQKIKVARKARLRAVFDSAGDGQKTVKLLAGMEAVVKMGVKIRR